MERTLRGETDAGLEQLERSEGAVRYADAPTAQCDTYIEASLERVWDSVCDIELPARLSPELQRVEWLDGANGPTLGARFSGHNFHPMLGHWRTTSQIVELDPARVLSWIVTDADGRFGPGNANGLQPMATWRFELEPEGSGTRLRQSVRIGPARSGVSLAIDRRPEREEQIVAHRIGELRAGMEATLAGTKALAEQAA